MGARIAYWRGSATYESDQREYEIQGELISKKLRESTLG